MLNSNLSNHSSLSHCKMTTVPQVAGPAPSRTTKLQAGAPVPRWNPLYLTGRSKSSTGMLPPGMLPVAHQWSRAHQVLLLSFLHAMFQNPLTFLYCLRHQCLQSINRTWKSPMRTNSTPPPEVRIHLLLH